MGIFNIGPASANVVTTAPGTYEGLELEGMLWHEEHSGIAKQQIMPRIERTAYANYIS